MCGKILPGQEILLTSIIYSVINFSINSTQLVSVSASRTLVLVRQRHLLFYAAKQVQ